MKRLPLLDMTRWFAALFVVLFHCLFMVEHIRVHYPVIKSLTQYGYLAVQLFFIISGFVIFMSVDNHKSPSKFIIARFIRLYPSYIFSVFFTFLFLYIFGMSDKITAVDFIGNFTMLPGYLGLTPLNSAYWSLGIEIIFYSFVAAMIFFIKNTETMFNIMALWLLVSIVNIIYPLGGLEKFMALKYCSLFVGGAAIYLLSKKITLYRMLIMLVSAPVSIYYALNHSNKLANLFNYFSYSPFVVAVMIILFYIWILFCVFSRQRPPFSEKVISVMAGSSYVLYLIHETIGRTTIRINPEYGIILATAMIVFLVVVAAAITIWFENPAIHALKRLFNRTPVQTIKPS